MSRFLCIVAFVFLLNSKVNAQFVSIEIGIDGFTCSMCAMSVEKALRQLYFVEDVKMDLNENKAQLSLRKDKIVSVNLIRDKIIGSGFSIRYIHATYNFEEIVIENYSVVKVKGSDFCFVKIGTIELKGIKTIVFLNKKLIAKSENVSWNKWIKSAPETIKNTGNLYFVTLLSGQ